MLHSHETNQDDLSVTIKAESDAFEEIKASVSLNLTQKN